MYGFNNNQNKIPLGAIQVEEKSIKNFGKFHLRIIIFVF